MEAGITLDELRCLANKATGLKKYPSDFTRARNGRDSSDSAKRMISAADKILSEIEEQQRRKSEVCQKQLSTAQEPDIGT